MKKKKEFFEYEGNIRHSKMSIGKLVNKHCRVTGFSLESIA